MLKPTGGSYNRSGEAVKGAWRTPEGSRLPERHFGGQRETAVGVRARAHGAAIGLGQRARDVKLPSRGAHPLAILHRPLVEVRELLLAELRASVLDLDYHLATAQEG